MEGASKKERCMSLFKEMQCFYRENSQNRLPTLTPGMLTKEDKKSKKKSWPKIRAKAGEARSLISFNKLIAEKLCIKDDQFETKLRQTARALEGCHSCLTKTWSYRDESFGHTMSQYAKRRGGEFSVLAVSKGMLLKFAADNPKPPLLQAV